MAGPARQGAGAKSLGQTVTCWETCFQTCLIKGREGNALITCCCPVLLSHRLLLYLDQLDLLSLNAKLAPLPSLKNLQFCLFFFLRKYISMQFCLAMVSFSFALGELQETFLSWEGISCALLSLLSTHTGLRVTIYCNTSLTT